MSKLQFGPVKRSRDVCDWVARDQVVLMAMRAFELALKQSTPPAGQQFLDADGPWSTRDQFASDLAFLFDAQLKSQAHVLGVDRGDFASQHRFWLINCGLSRPDGDTDVATTQTAAS